MKHIYFLTIIFFISLSLQAQSRKYFCEVKGIENEFSSGLKIVFDFGSDPVYSIWSGLKGSQKIVNEQGNEISFFSMVDAANYMIEKGWNFQQAYTSIYSDHAIHHWIFFKEARSKEEAGKGILTKEGYRKKQNQPK